MPMSSLPPDPEPTITLPAYPPPAPTTPAPRRSRALSAGVLTGSLLLGGAAGLGGAAAYEHLFAQPSTSTPSTPSAPKAEAPISGPAGSVEQVAATVLPSVVQINVVTSNGGGTGSGVITTADGVIVTNNHVVRPGAGEGTITVNFHDGTSAKAKVLGTDPVTDIAVIKAEGKSGLPVAAIGDSSALRVGESVVAIGSPFGLEATVTTGIVSALNRAVSVGTQEDANPFGGGNSAGSTTYPAIQTDAAINPGNSGGPLVNMRGAVIGINSSIRTAGAAEGGSIGLGFAIPINSIMPIVEQLQKGEAATHARLGVSVGNNAQGDQLATGALVKSVEPGSAADKAGLKVGDVIVKVEEAAIPSSDSLVATVRSYRPGDKVKITYLRGGQKSKVSVALGSDQAEQTS